MKQPAAAEMYPPAVGGGDDGVGGSGEELAQTLEKIVS